MGATHRFIILFTVVSSWLFAACSNANQVDLPNQVPVQTRTADNVILLEGWSFTDKQAPYIERMSKPDNPAFDGALLWYGYVETQDAKKAALSMLEAEGFENAKIKSVRQAYGDLLKQIDGHPEAEVTMLIIEGRLSGKPARANVYTWFGTILDPTGKKTMTHVFMAPVPIYEAMGGIAVNAVYNLNASVNSGTNMLELGQLSADESSVKMVELFHGWAVDYITNNIMLMQLMGQTMSMNQQVLDSMQSYNNALSQCGGLDCNISQGADGLWTATPD